MRIVKWTIQQVTQWHRFTRQSAQLQDQEAEIVRNQTQMQALQYDHSQEMTKSEQEVLALRDLGNLAIVIFSSASNFPPTTNGRDGWTAVPVCYPDFGYDLLILMLVPIS